MPKPNNKSASTSAAATPTLADVDAVQASAADSKKEDDYISSHCFPIHELKMKIERDFDPCKEVLSHNVVVEKSRHRLRVMLSDKNKNLRHNMSLFLVVKQNNSSRDYFIDQRSYDFSVRQFKESQLMNEEIVL